MRVPTHPGSEDIFEEVVRDVSLTLHLANGSDVIVPSTGEVTILIDDAVMDQIRAALEAEAG